MDRLTVLHNLNNFILNEELKTGIAIKNNQNEITLINDNADINEFVLNDDVVLHQTFIREFYKILPTYYRDKFFISFDVNTLSNLKHHDICIVRLNDLINATRTCQNTSQSIELLKLITDYAKYNQINYFHQLYPQTIYLVLININGKVYLKNLAFYLCKFMITKITTETKINPETLK